MADNTASICLRVIQENKTIINNIYATTYGFCINAIKQYPELYYNYILYKYHYIKKQNIKKDNIKNLLIMYWFFDTFFPHNLKIKILILKLLLISKIY
jgi:hypothetical protein